MELEAKDSRDCAVSSLKRREVIKPSMCGHNSLFVGQVGDWTWDAVNELCNTNVFKAENAAGLPTYLSFYYYHIKASENMHLGKLTFGDLIDIDTKLYSFGSESILTLHRVEGVKKDDPPDTDPLTLKEFFEEPKDNCIYVENFNRWVTRSKPGSNENLVKSSPADFQVAHLPELPEQYSPRRIYDFARRQMTFLAEETRNSLEKVESFSWDYQIDITRDLNGVGLLYFASYFSIVDKALWQVWSRQGRSNRDYLDRIITDHKLCFMGNANLDARLRLDITLWRGADCEYIDVVMNDTDSERSIAVATVKVKK